MVPPERPFRTLRHDRRVTAFPATTPTALPPDPENLHSARAAAARA